MLRRIYFEGEIARLSKKLDNRGFTDKAPAAVVEKEREKLRTYEEMLPTLEGSIVDTKRLMES